MEQLRQTSKRAGTYVPQPGNFEAFIPKPLPPEPPILLDVEMINLNSQADRSLGRLDGATAMIPNPKLFVYGYVRKEAVLSSQIEGTQTTLSELIEYESKLPTPSPDSDVVEVHNYVEAMNYGLKRLETMPISINLLKEIHRTLLKGARGQERSLGEFRKIQNWIGTPKSSIHEAVFVPPPPTEIQHALEDLERFIRIPDPTLPILITCGLVKAQFETIHPFEDGNGRIGRLLITFMLCEKKILSQPLLYLSDYFARHRGEYFRRLQDVRDSGRWEDWLKFYLRGVTDVSDEAFHTALEILRLQETDRKLSTQGQENPAKCWELLELLYQDPYTWVDRVAELLSVPYPFANQLVQHFVRQGILVQTRTVGNNPRYIYDKYVSILERGTGSTGLVQRS